MKVVAVDEKVIRRVRAAKARRRRSSARYRQRPKVTFILQSFNRAGNIKQLLAGLRRVDAHELIVCDDGSIDGSREKWTSCLTKPNDFLILSNDLHEIRILDRAIRFAAADIVCLVQDDDRIPDTTGWLRSALRQFRRHPRLAIIGGFMGFRSFHPDPAKAKQIWARAPFQFVHHVNIGPYFIRKYHYETLGGWDFSFSDVGEPGICFESEFCLRAWVKGYQVGYSFVPFKGPAKHYALDGGTMLFTPELRRKNQLRNHHKIFHMYFEHAGQIDRLVRNANRRVRLR
jgi:glycosyltransferase involved in cell wall biosynthesis